MYLTLLFKGWQMFLHSCQMLAVGATYYIFTDFEGKNITSALE